jgi:hypothetical protein
MDLHYACEKLEAALDCLVGAENIRRRLWRAWLECHPLQPDNLPADLAQQWRSIRRALTTFRALDETSGRLEPTLAFSDDEALAAIAREMCEVYHGVRDALEDLACGEDGDGQLLF